MPHYALSFQLYSARHFPPVEPVLDHLAELGYDAVEPFLPNYEADPKGFRRALDAAGLTVSGFHMPLAGLVNEPRRFFDYAHMIGTKVLIPPFVPQAERQPTVAFWRGIGEKLAAGAALAKAEGLRVAWHNHDFEYFRLDDRSRPFEHIMEAAGPDVEFEIDLAWITRAWASPAQELTRYADRITAIQLKDTARAGTTVDDGWTAPGDGVIDWPALKPLFAQTRADVLVVEHDSPSDWKKLASRAAAYAMRLMD